MTMASLLQAVIDGSPPKPVTAAMANWDGRLTVEAVNRVHEQKLLDMTGDRSSGEGRLRGSLLGACPRMQVLSYLGYRGEEESQESAEMLQDGTYRHYVWQERGLSIGFLTDIETKVKLPKWRFSGQLDGLMAPVEGLAGKGGFELKTTKWDYYKQVRDSGVPLFKHLLQIGGYCEALSLDWFSVVYELRSFKIEWYEIVVPYNAELRRITEANFRGSLGFIEREELPPVKPNYPDDKECAYWCGFKRICPQATW